jgi:hypothetical protein
LDEVKRIPVNWETVGRGIALRAGYSADKQSRINSGRSASMSDQTVWQIYEQRKADLQKQNLTNQEYQNAIRRLADELGI